MNNNINNKNKKKNNNKNKNNKKNNNKNKKSKKKKKKTRRRRRRKKEKQEKEEKKKKNKKKNKKNNNDHLSVFSLVWRQGGDSRCGDLLHGHFIGSSTCLHAGTKMLHRFAAPWLEQVSLRTLLQGWCCDCCFVAGGWLLLLIRYNTLLSQPAQGFFLNGSTQPLYKHFFVARKKARNVRWSTWSRPTKSG